MAAAFIGAIAIPGKGRFVGAGKRVGVGCGVCVGIVVERRKAFPLQAKLASHKAERIEGRIAFFSDMQPPKPAGELAE
jgi:hypothetical protein